MQPAHTHAVTRLASLLCLLALRVFMSVLMGLSLAHCMQTYWINIVIRKLGTLVVPPSKCLRGFFSSDLWKTKPRRDPDFQYSISNTFPLLLFPAQASKLAVAISSDTRYSRIVIRYHAYQISEFKFPGRTRKRREEEDEKKRRSKGKTV